MNIEQALAPIPIGTFLTEYWNRKPLLIRRQNPEIYDMGLAMETPESLILSGRLQYPEIRLIRKGQKVPLQMMFESGLFGRTSKDGAPRLGALRQAYLEGYTIVLRAETVSRPVARLCRSLEAEVRRPVLAEMFCTPKGSQGSNLHHDPFDVFVLQLSGIKHWKVYAPTGKESTKIGVQTTVEQVGPLLLDDQLAAGDLLYIPCSFPHVALTSGDAPSVHLSLAAEPLRWSDVVHEAATMAMEQNRDFTRLLPVGYLNGNEDEAAELASLCARLFDHVDAAAIRNRLAAKFCSGLQPSEPDYFQEATSFEEVTPETLFRLVPGSVVHVDVSSDPLHISFPGNQLSLPRSTAATLNILVNSEGKAFSARSITSNLDERSRTVLLKHLHKAGLLTLADKNLH